MKAIPKPLCLMFPTLISLALSTSAAQQAMPHYTLSDLGALSGYPYSRAYGINDRGQVVGQVAKVEPKLEAHAVLWDGQNVRDISSPPGLPYSVAQAINDNALPVAVCGSGVENYGSHGFQFMGLPDRAYSWFDGKFNNLSGKPSHAYSLNNRGAVVGEEERKATMWDGITKTVLNSLPDSLFSSARAINDVGQIAGFAINKDSKRQAVWWNDGQIQLLGTLPGQDESMANAINAKSVIVGSSSKDNSQLPFIWRQGKMEMLSPLEGRTWLNDAQGINNSGQIVGYGMQDGVYMHAVLWQERLPNFWMPLDLNDLIPAGSGLVLMKATAINDKGQIVGEARDAKAQIHAFLLTPLPDAK